MECVLAEEENSIALIAGKNGAEVEVSITNSPIR